MSKIREYSKEILLVVAAIITFMAGIYGLLLIRWQDSDGIVSGIVYNNQNNSIFSGNTYFSVRALENTVVTRENASRFCLPPNSPYIELVNEAARNKNIKVVVTTSKMFMIASSPWQCIDNVKVEKQQ